MSLARKIKTKRKIKSFQKIIRNETFDSTFAVDGYWGKLSKDAVQDDTFYFELDTKFLNKYLHKVNPVIRESMINYLMYQMNTFKYKGTLEAKNPLFIAYILATILHETAYTMTPLEEYGKGRGRPYGTIYTNSKGVKYGYKNSRGIAYDYNTFPHIYYGRGFVQLTWYDNYRNMSEILQVNLLDNPEMACDPEVAAKVAIYGMLDGTFTGKSLDDYIKYGLNRFEFVNARRIINGTDSASRIANLAYDFLDNLTLKVSYK